MWMLALALAADPVPAPIAPAALRAACPAGQQRCVDRCVPWSEPCAANVRESVAEMSRAAQEASLATVVCGPSPVAPTPPPATVDQQILLSAAAGLLCGTEQRGGNPEACQPDPAERDILAPPPVTATPTCGAAPPPAPTAKPK